DEIRVLSSCVHAHPRLRLPAVLELVSWRVRPPGEGCNNFSAAGGLPPFPGVYFCSPRVTPVTIAPSSRGNTMVRNAAKWILGGFVLALAVMLGGGLPAQAAPPVTSPREFFGFNLGDDYCLANYQQLSAYWAKLERESDRLKLVRIGV